MTSFNPTLGNDEIPSIRQLRQRCKNASVPKTTVKRQVIRIRDEEDSVSVPIPNPNPIPHSVPDPICASEKQQRPPPPPPSSKKRKASVLPPPPVEHRQPTKRQRNTHCERYMPERPSHFVNWQAERNWHDLMLFVVRLDIYDDELKREYLNQRILNNQRLCREAIAGRLDVMNILNSETRWLREELVRLDTRLREYRSIEYQSQYRLSYGDNTEKLLQSQSVPRTTVMSPSDTIERQRKREEERNRRDRLASGRWDDMALEEETIRLSWETTMNGTYAT